MLPTAISSRLPFLSWISSTGHDDFFAGVILAKRELNWLCRPVDDGTFVTVGMGRQWYDVDVLP